MLTNIEICDLLDTMGVNLDPTLRLNFLSAQLQPHVLRAFINVCGGVAFDTGEINKLIKSRAYHKLNSLFRKRIISALEDISDKIKKSLGELKNG